MIKKVTNFLTPEEGNYLYSYADGLLTRTKEEDFKKNPSRAWDRTIVTEFLMLKKQFFIGESYDRKILPNYSSIVVYSPDAKVDKHVSPIKHDVTVIINLFDENRWPVHFGRPNSEEDMVETLKQNEAFVFDGHDYTTWRDFYKGPKYYLECQLHYVCSCRSCVGQAYYGFLKHPLTSIVYPKLKEGLVSKIDNQPYEHLRAELETSWRKHAIANKENLKLQELLRKKEEELERYES